MGSLRSTIAISVLFMLHLCCNLHGEEFKDEYARFAAELSKCDKIVIYEGLPHQIWEGTLLERELKKDISFKLHKYPFYNDPLKISDDELKRIQDVVVDPIMFRRYEEQKLCGGFHPDYLIEWSKGSKKYHMLVCLGCHETECYGADIPIYCDMTKSSHAALSKLFADKRKNRPKAE